ncbi:hypothetical protein [Virgibacillus sp. LDC-1]|uniref:hypothetical protein n=1 Tax=Virgibacillus sp. LDC-1 TaxID=3039856 RepID=UPI0024DE8B7E|nr:hypothetical protein [Virgibacillus sp. LDC-1]
MKHNLFKLSFLLIVVMLIAVGCKLEGEQKEPPHMQVKINEITIEAQRGSYKWQYGNQHVVADAAAPFQIAANMDPVVVPAGESASILFTDQSEPEIEAYLWEETRSGTLEVDQNELTLPVETGTHIIEVFATWKAGEASYTFVVLVQ